MTALADKQTFEEESDGTQPKGIPVPPDIDDRLTRGREAMRRDANLRRLCQKFFANEHYWYLNAQRQLKFLSTALVDVSGGKAAHRIRNTYNFVGAIVEGKVSAVTQRVPGYEVDPSSSDWEDWGAARISEQIAYYGYDKWFLRRMSTKVATLALVQREGFAMPYFDASIGPYDENGNARGELRTLVFSRSEVMWEPGQDFLDSRWHATERAMLPSEIRAIPGFVGGALNFNARTSDIPDEKTSEKMCLLTDYLERPCKKYPMGRRCFVHDGRIIVDFRLELAEEAKGEQDPDRQAEMMDKATKADWWETYPYMDANGVVADEPVLHRLSYTVNPEGDDLGLVERLIDLMRTINDCWNKLLEWKNRCLMPRIMAPWGSQIRTNDVPGGVDFYKPTGMNKPEWEKSPPVPRELFEMLNLAVDQMRALASDVDVQPDPDVTARTSQLAVEQARLRWQSFLGDFAEFQSRFMRHCLCIVSRFYTEERIIDIRGRYGWEDPLSFTGQDLRSQVNVRVLTGSIESKSRAQTMQELEFFQKLYPGAISPEAAMAALHGGSAEGLLRSYQLDVAYANRVVQMLRKGPQAMLLFQPRFDPEFGDPMDNFMVPGWMPRKTDNVAIWKQVVADYTKTDDFMRQPPQTQQTFLLVFNGLEMVERQRMMLMMSQEQGMAAQLGQANAARPQDAIPTPQMQGGLSPEQAAPAALSA